MPVKITDIAKLAGISSSSVSRILNGTGRYSLETAKRVKRIAKNAGYYKDRSAADLARKNTQTVGIIYSNSKTNFNNIVINGILATADQKNIDILLMATQKDKYSHLLKIVRNMIERRISLLLLVSIQPTNKIIKMLRDAKINIKLVGTSTDMDIPFISSDDFLMGYQATMSLIEAGHQQIGMAGNDISRDYVGQLRYKGYLKALQDSNINFKPDWLFTGDFSYTSGINAAKYFHQKKNVSAIVGVSDEVSFGLLNGFYDLGDNVPKDFAVISIDGTDICNMARPKLTSVTQNFILMGELAINKVGYKDNIIVPFKIIRRKTI